MEKRYSIGIDFGTESGRAVLVELDSGREITASVYKYKDGVIDEFLPGSKVKMEHDWALQNPEDYIRTLKNTIPALLRKSRVKPGQVIGVGIDFTACTMLPTDKKGRPLCTMKKFRKNPNAWVKLWKHHAAQPEADRINLLAAQRNEKFLARYGGKISSEWFFPKVLQILNESPEVYESADRFIEAADWVVWQLTGVESRNACTAGYKAIWDGESGFPGKEFFKALDQRLENVIDGKMCRNISQLGECAGGITKPMARMTGLKQGTPVAVANVDAHVAVPAATVTQPGKMVMIMGTSICHMVMERELRLIPGLCGVVKDGILPGYYGYEAGQSAVGDIFAWFIEHGVPLSYHREAQRKRVNIHALLAEKASVLRPGSTGLLAIDWWNGNRSVLTDADLYGLILGFTLNTKPEEIYRALIEATAFGTYKIIKTIEENSLPVEELYACGGLPEKNKLLMQIYADVTGRSIKVAASSQCSALGSAMFGAVAAGTSRGGYANIMEAAGKMAKLKDEVFSPDSHSHKVYQELFSEYDRLHDYFGRGENEVMKRLKRIKADTNVKKDT